MPLVVIEGGNDVGKSTVIKMLKEKHPHLESMAFPDDRTILEKQYNRTNLANINVYHDQFLHDFERREPDIRKMLADGKVVILDRYFMSHFAYFVSDVFRVLTNTVSDITIRSQAMDTIINNLMSCYRKNRIRPDLVIFISSNSTDHPQKKPEEIDSKVFLYGMIVGRMMGKKNTISVLGKQPDTLQLIEDALVARGYI